MGSQGRKWSTGVSRQLCYDSLAANGSPDRPLWLAMAGNQVMDFPDLDTEIKTTNMKDVSMLQSSTLIIVLMCFPHLGSSRAAGSVSSP